MNTQEINKLPWEGFLGSSVCGVVLDDNAIGVWYGKQAESGHDALFVLHKVDGKHKITGRIKNAANGQKESITHTDPYARTEAQAIERVDMWMKTAPGVTEVKRFLMRDYTPETFAKEFMAAGLVEARNVAVCVADGSLHSL